MKRLLADGHARIFQIAQCFRRGEQGQHHNPEFTMLEWYRANAGVEDVMKDTEQLVAMRHLGARSARRAHDRHAHAVRTLDGVRSVRALRRHRRGRDPRPRRERRGALLPAHGRVGRAGARARSITLCSSSTTLPRRRRSLEDARTIRASPSASSSTSAGIELCNGFGELIDPVEQRARLDRDRAERTARGLPVYPIDERFLDALKNVPPSGGNALGVDRLVALVCGGTEIRKVMAFTVEEL